MAQIEKIDVSTPQRPRVASLVQELKPSGIREFFDLVLGRDDIISLGVGEPDFVTPWRIREGANFSVMRGETSYTSNSGLMSLRKSIAGYLGSRFDVSVDPVDEILITVGVSEAVDLAFRALLNPGDEVIIPEPCYIAYDPLIRLAGGVPVPVVSDAETNFSLDVDALQAALTPRTRAMLINYPSNPTGSTLSPEAVESIGKWAAKNEIVIISDEIYAEMSYQHKHKSFASVPEATDWTVVLSGFSKSFAMTGWRVGYAAGPADIISAMTKVHQYNMLCAPIMSQRAAEIALNESISEMESMVESFRQRCNYFHSGLLSVGLDCHLPQGAFYAFPSIKKTGLSSTDFCKRLLKEENVAVVPGSAFGESGEGYFRASYAASYETLDEAIAGLGRFLGRL